MEEHTSPWPPPPKKKKKRTQKRNHLHQSALPFGSSTSTKIILRSPNLSGSVFLDGQSLHRAIPVKGARHFASRHGVRLIHIDWYKRSEDPNWNTCWFHESKLVLKSSCHLYSNQHQATSHEPDKNHPKEQVADNRKCQVHTCTWSAQRKSTNVAIIVFSIDIIITVTTKTTLITNCTFPPRPRKLYCIEGS